MSVPRPRRDRPSARVRGAAAPARVLAARVLERVEDRGAWADAAFEQAIGPRSLAARDVALATELVYGTLRWQRYLDWILAPHSRPPLRDLDPRVRILLRMAAYQIVFLERVPAFAAVNDAVALAPRGSRGAAGFLNAVLRSFARRGRLEREPALPADPLDALATRCSFPTWLAARWVARYGAAHAEALMRALNERPPLTVRANTLVTTREALAARLTAEEGVECAPGRYAPEAVRVAHGGAPGTWRAFAEGACVVQDEASMLVGHLLDPPRGGLVADACAAPGTKTTHLAQLMRDSGRILAMDPQPARLVRVREASTRLRLSSVETLEGPVEALAPKHRAACDAVLVDAPCTNLGVVRRNPDVKWRRIEAELAPAAANQRAIVAAAAAMVRPGGRLVYATCSLEPEENDAVIADFLSRHPEFHIDPPASFPVVPDAAGFVRCLPHVHGTDGFTAVRLAHR